MHRLQIPHCVVHIVNTIVQTTHTKGVLQLIPSAIIYVHRTRGDANFGGAN